MTCKSCQPMDVEWPIESPDDLTKVLRFANEKLAAGTLIEPEEGRRTWSQRVHQLAESGPWPDSVECQLACASCGERFEFYANTYHGRGGRWFRVED